MDILNTFVGFVVGVVVSGLSLVGIQTPFTPPTLILSATPTAIEAGEASSIEWSTTGADECISTEIDTGNNTSGTITVAPGKTTTYTITCSKTASNASAETGVWREVGSDITDLWCTSRQPSFRNLYTENPCPATNPEGQRCTETSELCAVNRWQTKGGGVGDLGSPQYCNLVSELYRCVSDTNNASASYTAPVQTTKTVFSGEFGDLVAPHLSYRAKLQQEVNAHGGPFTMDGFYDDKPTADRICATLFPGSTNGSYKSDKYASPKNNTLLRWDGTRWTQQGAKSHQRHLRYAFTCVAPVDAPTPVLTTETKTVTKSITVTVLDAEIPDGSTPGGGGGGQCSDTIDNDGDGRIDGADFGCQLPGSSKESPNPQCSDGIDNNNNGLTDSADIGACSGPTDNNERFADGSTMLEVPALVQRDEMATLTWSVQNVRAGTCTLTGTNGDSWNLSGASGVVTSSKMQNEATFTITCTDLNAQKVTVSKTVKIAPTFRED